MYPKIKGTLLALLFKMGMVKERAYKPGLSAMEAGPRTWPAVVGFWFGESGGSAVGYRLSGKV